MISRQLKIFILLFVSACSICAFAEAQDLPNAEKRRGVNLEWEAVEGATVYELRVVRLLKDGKRNPPFFFKVNSASWNGSINPGQYEMTLRTYDDRDVPGDWSDPIPFVVKANPPRTIAPTSGEKVATKQTEKYEVGLSWEDPSKSGRYEIEIESTDGDYKEKINVEGQKTKLTLDVSKIS